MNEMIWVPLVAAACGIVVSLLMSLSDRKIGELLKDPQIKIDSDSDLLPGLDIDALARSGIESLRPKSVKDEDAKTRLPYLMMYNGSYPLGDVNLKLRQSGF